MRLEFSLHREAREELRKSIIYYRDNVSAETAAEFLEIVEEAILSLRDHPVSAQLVLKDVRRKITRKFPFSIFYYVSNSRLRILAVAHQSRRPYYWLGRE